MMWIRMMAAAALAASAPAAAQQPNPAGQPPAAAAPDYAQPASWLCLPGRADPCGVPLATTALNPNGYGSIGAVRPAADPAIDCFYVYPTVSLDPGLNSDLVPGAQETNAATVQFARFATVCKPYAPIYRQATIAALLGALSGGGDAAAAMELAYGDVASAWRTYLAQHNKGRRFVLVGHSQGTIHLTRLIASEIENGPAAPQMLSAILLGFNVEVPEGQRVGGSFRKTPLCARLGETGCVITYTSYRATNPPPANALLGRSATPGMTVGCTNPARLRRETTPLDSYWPTGALLGGRPDPIAWSSGGTPPTPFLRTEGLASASCVNRGSAGYLSVIVNADPADARTDQIPGDVAVAGRPLPGWGLHLADMNLAQGDLIALVEAQAVAYRRSAAR
jgi:hypothetical protein